MKKKLLSFTLSLMLILALVPQISFANEVTKNIRNSESNMDIDNKHVITGFVDLETSDYYYEGDPTEEELTLNLPETLQVYLDGESTPTEIEVSWESIENFDKTDFYFYSMKPIWNEDYILSESLSEIIDVPWITVYKQEPKNEEIEPILTEEDIDPVYTLEDGSVNPEASNLSSIATSAFEGISNSTGKLIRLFSDDVYAAENSNTDAIYKYLTGTMGLNTAAACGVMINLNAESGMSSTNLQNTYNKSLALSDSAYTSRVDKGKGAYKNGNGVSKNFKTDRAGYGLCQWTSEGRKANLLEAAISSGVSIGDLNMQLAFLNTELQNSYAQVYHTLKNVPNTPAGAYIAAAEFCMCYEIPQNTVATAAARGKNCLSSYWETYSGKSASVSKTSFISLCAYTYPKAIKTGKGLSVKGYAISNYSITTITGKIINSNGKTLYTKTLKPWKTAYSLYSLDEAMKFSKLSSGTYKYQISATDASGKTVKATHTFKVSNTSSTSKEFGFATLGTSSSSSSETESDKLEGGSDIVPAKTTFKGSYPKLPKRGYFKKGDKGKEVKKLQTLLNWCGHKVSTGGTYGPKTVAAVKKLQKSIKIKQDGKFGKTSLKKVKLLKR